jgi:hypothetical protein
MTTTAVGRTDGTPAPKADVRGEYVAGLRALADVLQAHDNLPLPTDGQSGSPLDWWVYEFAVEDPKATMAAIVRALPGAKAKTVGEYGASAWLTVSAQLRGLHIDINSRREAVCTRVVKDVREVTREVPDPDALAAVPTVTVTETVEDVEWVCEPLLASEAQA